MRMRYSKYECPVVGVELTLFAGRMQVQRFCQMVHSPAHLCSRSLIALLLECLPKQCDGRVCKDVSDVRMHSLREAWI